MTQALRALDVRRTFCRICEAHCGVLVETDRDGRLAAIVPDRTHPISQGFVCAKGTRFLEVADHSTRVIHPMLRQADGTFERVSWNTGLGYFRDRIRPILERHGPHAVALYFGTPAVHNSLGALAYFAFARALGTRNLYSAGSQDNNSKIVAARLVHGNEWVQPIMDLEHADFALLIGTNPAISRGTYSQLPGGTTAYDRFVRRGGRAVFVDPRRTESADRWGGHLAIRPGADVYLLLALLHELRDLYAPSAFVDGMERLLRLSAEYPAERAARLTGISIERIRDLADAIRTVKRATFFVSVGVSQGPFGTLCAVAIQALAYVTGNFDREGGLLFQPWSAALGTMLRFSRQPSRVGAYTANAGGLPGGILADEILTPGPERIRALIVMSGNPLTSMPDERRLQEAFRHLDLLVTIDMFTNETGREAHLVLPATSWLERADLAAWNAAFVQESFIDSTPAMRPPPGEARPEWRIFADLSLAAGRPLLGWATRLACKVPFDRMVQPLANLVALPFRRMMPSAQGVPWRRPRGGTYLRGRRRVRFWSAELESEPHRIETHATELTTALPDDSSFILLCRRRRFAQNSWIHGATRNGDREAYASLCSADMKRLDLERDDSIELQSAAGAIRIPVRADEGVMAGTVVVPHGLPGTNVNILIGSHPSLIEPLSGMHRMSGHRVELRKLRPS